MTRSSFADTPENNYYQFPLRLALITAGLVYIPIRFPTYIKSGFLLASETFPEIIISTGCGNSL